MNIFDAAKDKLGRASSDHPEQAEQVSDRALDTAAQLAEERTGGQHADAAEKARHAVDERVGVAGDPTQGGVVLEEGEPTGADPDSSNLPTAGP